MPDNSLVANRTVQELLASTVTAKYWVQNQGNEAVVVGTVATIASPDSDTPVPNGRIVTRLETIEVKNRSGESTYVVTIEGNSSKVAFGIAP